MPQYAFVTSVIALDIEDCFTQASPLAGRIRHTGSLSEDGCRTQLTV